LRASGDAIQVGSDGAIRVKDDGIVVAGDGDPCCCSITPGAACLFGCTGLPPLKFAGTLSGIPWTDWIRPGGHSGSPGVIGHIAHDFDPNGTYPLTQTAGNSCVWNYLPAAVTGIAWEDLDATCTTVDSGNDEVSSIGLSIIKISSTIWQVGVTYDSQTMIAGNVTTAAGVCNAPFSITQNRTFSLRSICGTASVAVTLNVTPL
jgi:hypothetical protein